MKCTKCGCNLPEDSEFCQYCGTKIEAVIAPLQEPEFNKEEAMREIARTVAYGNRVLQITQKDRGREIIFSMGFNLHPHFFRSNIVYWSNKKREVQHIYRSGSLLHSENTND